MVQAARTIALCFCSGAAVPMLIGCARSVLPESIDASDPSDSRTSIPVDASVGNPPVAPQIAAGVRHACVIRSGAVWCWGDNDSGQLGDGTTVERHQPVRVHGLTDAVEVVAGGGYTCARHAAGGVSCWGDNSYGQLADGTFEDRYEPVEIVGMEGARSLFIAGGSVCALSEGGVVSCVLDMGVNAVRPPPAASTGARAWITIPDALEASPAEFGTCARRADGRVVCWGTRSPQPFTPPQVDGSPYVVEALDGVTSLAAVVPDACVARVDGGVWCWGYNGSPPFSDGGAVPFAPRPLPNLTDAKLVRGGYSNPFCAVRTIGAVACWGNTEDGALGDGTTASLGHPGMTLQVQGLSHAVDVAVGDSFACALRDDAAVLCWGNNDRGQLGDGTTTVRGVAQPVLGL